MKFYNMAMSYGIDGGRVESIESTKGKWVARDDAEQAVKDAVWAAKMIVRHGQHLDEMIIQDAQAIIERYEGGRG